MMKRHEARRAVRSLAADVAESTARTLEQQAIRSVLLGSLVALHTALSLHFQPRSYNSRSTAYEREVTRHLRMLAHGSSPKTGKWLAGFYFNSYLQHLASAYHRLLKLITQRHDSVPCLVAIAVAQGSFTDADVDALMEVHRDVNDLKHTKEGRLRGRRVQDPAFAVRAARQAVGLWKKVP